MRPNAVNSCAPRTGTLAPPNPPANDDPSVVKAEATGFCSSNCVFAPCTKSRPCGDMTRCGNPMPRTSPAFNPNCAHVGILRPCLNSSDSSGEAGADTMCLMDWRCSSSAIRAKSLDLLSSSCRRRSSSGVRAISFFPHAWHEAHQVLLARQETDRLAEPLPVLS